MYSVHLQQLVQCSRVYVFELNNVLELLDGDAFNAVSGFEIGDPSRGILPLGISWRSRAELGMSLRVVVVWWCDTFSHEQKRVCVLCLLGVGGCAVCVYNSNASSLSDSVVKVSGGHQRRNGNSGRSRSSSSSSSRSSGSSSSSSSSSR